MKLTKLTGLTNVTYKAEIIDAKAVSQVTPSVVIFRQYDTHIYIFERFGEAEGFVDKELERFIFSEIGSIGVGPKEYACGPRWRIEEFIEDGEHPDCPTQNDANFQLNLMSAV